MQTQKVPYEDKRVTQLLKTTFGEDGRSLFDHLCSIYYQFQNEPKNIYTENMDYLEKLSQFLKKNEFRYQVPKSSEELNTVRTESYPWQQYRHDILKLLDESKPEKLNAIIPNFEYQNQILQLAGYGFSQEDAWLIQQSIKRLVSEQPAGFFNTLRFWGKMLTNGTDYFVVEAQLRKYHQEDLPEDTEQPGSGINEYVHYVTHDLCAEWCLLPCVNRVQMETSRKIKHTFSGDLNKSISSYPPFPGKEKHLLKAQILRITHSNLICPKALYKPNDENNKIVEFEDDFKIPEPTELATLDTWIHLPPNILKLGRVTHWADPQLTQEQQEQLLTDDPEVERLKGLIEDKPVEPYEQGWLIKTVGDAQVYQGLDDSALTYAAFVFKNYLWPGAITVCNKSVWASIYLGYGLKNAQLPFIPLAPNDLQEEPEDNEEFPEPNPQTLADELEPDSDDERRRVQELLEAQQQNA